MQTVQKERAPRNRTISLSHSEQAPYAERLVRLSQRVSIAQITGKTANQDMQSALRLLPEAFVDLLFVDPPYNLNKTFNSNAFKALSSKDYLIWMESWFKPLLRTLKQSASVYICGDGRSSSAIQLFAEKHLKIQNRIPWEREKGRGAESNWKNCSEDIWFCTVSDGYFFNPDAVRLKRRIIAPYKESGRPKDWEETDAGGF